MIDFKHLLFFTLCAFYVAKSQAGKAIIELIADDLQKRSDGGMHDKLKVQVRHEDGTEFRTEVESTPTLVARTSSGRVYRKELDNMRAFADDENVVLVERKGDKYSVKRAILNDVEYEVDSDGNLIYSSDSQNEIYKMENQVKQQARRELLLRKREEREQLYIDIGLYVDYSIFLTFSGNRTYDESIEALRAFFTCVALSVHLRFKRGVDLSHGQLNINVNYFYIADNTGNIISATPKSAEGHRMEFGMFLSSRDRDSDQYILFESQFLTVPFYYPRDSDNMMCTINAHSAIVMDKQLNVGIYVARLIGFALGVPLDSGMCPSSDGFIMSDDINLETFNSPNSWHFSACSQVTLEANVPTKDCLLRKENDTQLPTDITVKSKDEQCAEFIPLSFHCEAEQDALNFTDLCLGIICANGTGFCGSSPTIVPSEYTMCTNPADPLYGCIRGVCRFRYKKCFDEAYAANCATQTGRDLKRCQRMQRMHCRSMNILRG